MTNGRQYLGEHATALAAPLFAAFIVYTNAVGLLAEQTGLVEGTVVACSFLWAMFLRRAKNWIVLSGFGLAAFSLIGLRNYTGNDFASLGEMIPLIPLALQFSCGLAAAYWDHRS